MFDRLREHINIVVGEIAPLAHWSRENFRTARMPGEAEDRWSAACWSLFYGGLIVVRVASVLRHYREGHPETIEFEPAPEPQLDENDEWVGEEREEDEGGEAVACVVPEVESQPTVDGARVSTLVDIRQDLDIILATVEDDMTGMVVRRALDNLDSLEAYLFHQ